MAPYSLFLLSFSPPPPPLSLSPPSTTTTISPTQSPPHLHPHPPSLHPPQPLTQNNSQPSNPSTSPPPLSLALNYPPSTAPPSTTPPNSSLPPAPQLLRRPLSLHHRPIFSLLPHLLPILQLPPLSQANLIGFLPKHWHLNLTHIDLSANLLRGKIPISLSLSL
ncbi:hypothetical protein CsSME_00033998 [Camellia sinensis var. sinensis]